MVSVRYVVCIGVILALIVPLFVRANILDEPFFGGALGRAAYSVPMERMYHVAWENELRFSFPPDTGMRVENFIAKEVERVQVFARELGRVADTFAAVSITRLAGVVKHIHAPTVRFKANMYASAVASVPREETREPEVRYVEAPPREDVPHCSRAEGMARYTWCRMQSSTLEL